MDFFQNQNFSHQEASLPKDIIKISDYQNTYDNATSQDILEMEKPLKKVKIFNQISTESCQKDEKNGQDDFKNSDKNNSRNFQISTSKSLGNSQIIDITQQFNQTIEEEIKNASENRTEKQENEYIEQEETEKFDQGNFQVKINTTNNLEKTKKNTQNLLKTNQNQNQNYNQNVTLQQNTQKSLAKTEKANFTDNNQEISFNQEKLQFDSNKNQIFENKLNQQNNNKFINDKTKRFLTLEEKTQDFDESYTYQDEIELLKKKSQLISSQFSTVKQSIKDLDKNLLQLQTGNRIKFSNLNEFQKNQIIQFMFNNIEFFECYKKDDIKQIGSGSFGTVFQIKKKNLDQNYVLKIVEYEQTQFDKIFKEVELIQLLHQKIAEQINQNLEKNSQKQNFDQSLFIHRTQKLTLKVPTSIITLNFFLMEMDQGAYSLRDYLNKNIKIQNSLQNEQQMHYYLPLHEIKKIISDLIFYLSIMHQNSIAHSDIKPENIVYLEPQDRWVFIDFGISQDLSKNPPKSNLFSTNPLIYQTQQNIIQRIHQLKQKSKNNQQDENLNLNQKDENLNLNQKEEENFINQNQKYEYQNQKEENENENQQLSKLIKLKEELDNCDFRSRQGMSTHFLSGTLSYMCPEKFEKQAHNPFQDDIYALGNIFFEILGFSKRFKNSGNLSREKFNQLSEKFHFNFLGQICNDKKTYNLLNLFGSKEYLDIVWLQILIQNDALEFLESDQEELNNQQQFDILKYIQPEQNIKGTIKNENKIYFEFQQPLQSLVKNQNPNYYKNVQQINLIADKNRIQKFIIMYENGAQIIFFDLEFQNISAILSFLKIQTIHQISIDINSFEEFDESLLNDIFDSLFQIKYKSTNIKLKIQLTQENLQKYKFLASKLQNLKDQNLIQHLQEFHLKKRGLNRSGDDENQVDLVLNQILNLIKEAGKNLKKLDLKFIHLKQETHFSKNYLLNFPNLNYLDIDSIKINQETLKQVTKLENLTDFIINHIWLPINNNQNQEQFQNFNINQKDVIEMLQNTKANLKFIQLPCYHPDIDMQKIPFSLYSPRKIQVLNFDKIKYERGQQIYKLTVAKDAYMEQNILSSNIKFVLPKFQKQVGFWNLLQKRNQSLEKITIAPDARLDSLDLVKIKLNSEVLKEIIFSDFIDDQFESSLLQFGIKNFSNTLKTLEIQHCQYFQGNLIGKILENCPELQNFQLKLDYTPIQNLQKINYTYILNQVSQLKNLETLYIYAIYYPLYFDLTEFISQKNIQLKALNLSRFPLKDSQIKKIVNNFPNLQTLILNNIQVENVETFIFILKNLKNLKKLEFSVKEFSFVDCNLQELQEIINIVNQNPILEEVQLTGQKINQQIKQLIPDYKFFDHKLQIK
ncbi:Protein kinase-like domain [Pseudocohnilembus persalinus]|uniref:non-specific serine/threonine protein kinase n=1 Tax=Pseudocohnilembus persalinus TaxID=266149 RepID=A0A0V0QBF9_PSEPJ|nr:Protein kinase-like domain [Pseudocohnilembus persalinus]|eukprot:KRW99561.1 Protein kinase-like domain [Pseudocohnilembus persalinus]